MNPQEQDASRLQEALGDFYAGRMDRNAVRSAVLDVVLARMGCSRVSMWKFEGPSADLKLLCFASKTAGGQLDSSERRLARSEFRDYFNALIERGVYVSSDAMNDAALQGMRQSYLVTNNVRSLLDAAFMLNGRTYGMVCCEETSALRDWRAGDVVALRAIVSRLALLMSGAPESVLWSTPSLPARAL
ncbi:MAG: GAF domain-containing protein [Burkholderiales bacterium]|nr:GAF domain-containing protein [Burkholderiales bacterium]